MIRQELNPETCKLDEEGSDATEQKKINHCVWGTWLSPFPSRKNSAGTSIQRPGSISQMTHWRLRWCQSSVHPWHPLHLNRSFTSVPVLHTHTRQELDHCSDPSGTDSHNMRLGGALGLAPCHLDRKINLQVRLHSNLDGSSLAHAIQVPMGSLQE